MAAIDFPASPTTGQLFSAANGVTYRWNGTIWIVQAGPGGGTGDFCANQTSSLPLVDPTERVMVLTQIISGNSGSWYSTSTGRYTPPAGRYTIHASLTGQYSSVSISHFTIWLYKNGVLLSTSRGTPATSSYCCVEQTLTVDANGTDYFEFTAASNAGVASLIGMTFLAFPLTGMAGPMGPPFGGGTGDFMAAASANFALGAVATVLWDTVQTGNSGSWYSTSTGRYTPPAGRYNIFTEIYGRGNAATMQLDVTLRKNGVVIATAAASTAASLFWTAVPIEVIVDANGTDWFDVQGAASAASTGNGRFLAFPLTGMQGPQGPAGPDSKLLQSVSFETGAVATGTTVIPADDTIPQITEGNEYMTCAITPKSATSKLIIDVVWNGANNSAAATLVAALFQDSTANALAASWMGYTATNATLNIKFTHTMISGTTSATTFRVRAGGTVAGTTTFNGVVAGRFFGGTMASSIVIHEEAP